MATFQHFLTMFGGTITLPVIVANAMCVAGDIVAKSELISTILFVSGISTILQSTVGTRSV